MDDVDTIDIVDIYLLRQEREQLGNDCIQTFRYLHLKELTFKWNLWNITSYQ